MVLPFKIPAGPWAVDRVGVTVLRPHPYVRPSVALREALREASPSDCRLVRAAANRLAPRASQE
ncbi:MAG: hypothetical protein SH850_29500, partial [Planctomycetaceae bacterium]|nr:hypothetical protein [Planctomycetaceae bacterium]